MIKVFPEGFNQLFIFLKRATLSFICKKLSRLYIKWKDSGSNSILVQSPNINCTLLLRSEALCFESLIILFERSIPVTCAA